MLFVASQNEQKCHSVSLLRDLKQANIVTLHDIIHTPKSLTLVFEYLERDLKQYMDEMGKQRI